MDDQVVTEKLRAALPESLGPVGLRRPAVPALGVEASVTGYGSELIAALLPVVREIAAEELREAARDLDDGEFSDRVSVVAARAVRARADALTGEAS